MVRLEKLEVVVDYAPSQADQDVVREGIVASNEGVIGERDKAFSVFLKNDTGQVFGGLQAFRDSESVYVDVLWVKEGFQKQGYGSKLLAAVEQEGVENGCTFSLVDTWDFQAEGFYLKNGYARIGEIKNYWHGHSKIFLRKKLRSSGCNLQLRRLVESDLSQLVARYSFPWSDEEKTRVLWNTYWEEQKSGVRTVAIAEREGEILGYGSLLRRPECPFFRKSHIPEINAVWIHENHREQGIGSSLIGWIEDLARKEGYDQIGIGVGLYRDYGPAQRLYFKLGYVPDGNGVTYKGESVSAGHPYVVDDDLILWLKKRLERS